MCSDQEYHKKILQCVQSLQSLSAKPVAIHSCRTVPLGPVVVGGLFSGEFPVGMSPDEGGVVGGS